MFRLQLKEEEEIGRTRGTRSERNPLRWGDWWYDVEAGGKKRVLRGRSPQPTGELRHRVGMKPERLSAVSSGFQSLSNWGLTMSSPRHEFLLLLHKYGVLPLKLSACQLINCL